MPWAIKSFKKNNPNTKIVAYGATKARLLKNDEEIKYGLGWIFSRRGTLILTEDKLICNDWQILISDIKKASILKFQGFFSKGLVLKIKTKDNKNYHFGLIDDPVWENQNVLLFEIDTQKIKYSWFSILVRILLLIWLINFIIGFFTRK